MPSRIQSENRLAVGRKPKAVKPRPEKVKDFPFLDLPGEIRNRIYDLVFIPHRVLVKGSRPQKSLDEMRKKSKPGEQCKKPAYRLSCWFKKAERPTLKYLPLNYVIPRKDAIQTSLLRTCRKIYDEATPVLYSRVIARFESMATLTKFLNKASPHGVRSMESLEILHRGYGEPVLLDAREWKIRHDRKWMAQCKRVAGEMTALRHVVIDLHICDWPTQLEVNASWAKPLIALKGQREGFESVSLTLRNGSFSQKALEACAEKIALRMLSEDAVDEREKGSRAGGKKFEAKMAPRPIQAKATKAIIIKFTNNSLPKAATKITMPTINASLLPMYTKVDAYGTAVA